MNKTKSLIFFEELLLEIWHKLRWYSSGVVLAVITEKLNQLEESQIDRARAIYLESKGMTAEEGRQEAEETLRLAEEAKKEAQRKALEAKKEAREKKIKTKDASDSAWEKLE